MTTGPEESQQLLKVIATILRFEPQDEQRVKKFLDANNAWLPPALSAWSPWAN
jgi:hypothetical protein